MTISSITLTNPGAETGDITGWTVSSGAMTAATTVNGFGSPHAGTYLFKPGTGISFAQMYQTIAVDAAYNTAIDAGNATAVASAWLLCTSNQDTGELVLIAYDGSMNALDQIVTGALQTNGSWVNASTLGWRLPVGTRNLRIYINNQRQAGSNIDVGWDEFALTLSDNAALDYPVKAYQLGTYTWGSVQTDHTSAFQLGAYIFGAAETSSGNYQVYAHQLGVYAWVRASPRRRRMQAWTFSLDGHDFYVLELAGEGTIVYDLITGQWCEWRTEGAITWRARIGANWLGMGKTTADRLYGTNVVCGDNTLGILWMLDPTQGYDDATSGSSQVSFTRYVTGYVPLRMRETQPNAAVYITLNLGAPTISGATVTLRTSDDNGHTFYDHGSNVVTASDWTQEVGWRGLGLMRSPGRLFELTDNGAAVRIAAADMR